MMHKRVLFAALMLSCLIFSDISKAKAESLDISNIGGWAIKAYTDKKTRRFKSCTAMTGYNNGVSVGFVIDGHYNWWMGLASESWRLTTGDVYDLTYFIDRGPRHHASATATDAILVTIRLHDSVALFNRMRAGNVLTVKAQGETFEFKLTHSSRALAATVECVKTYVGRSSGATNPFVSRTPAPEKNETPETASAQSDETASAQSEAVVLLANILSAADVRGFKFVSNAELPTLTKDWHAAAGTAEFVAALRLVDADSAASVEQLSGSLLATDAQGCKGTFASGRNPAEDPGVARLMTGCHQGDGKALHVDYTIAPRENGRFYVLGIAALDGSATPRDLQERVYQATVQALTSRN